MKAASPGAFERAGAGWAGGEPPAVPVRETTIMAHLLLGGNEQERR
jgi:hypothetical protein